MTHQATQKDWVLAELKRGATLTPLDALNGCGCFRLAAVVHSLRQDGYSIETENYKLPSGKTVARYSLRNYQTSIFNEGKHELFKQSLANR